MKDLKKEFEETFKPNKERLNEWEVDLLTDYGKDIWSWIVKKFRPM